MLGCVCVAVGWVCVVWCGVGLNLSELALDAVEEVEEEVEEVEEVVVEVERHLRHMSSTRGAI